MKNVVPLVVKFVQLHNYLIIKLGNKVLITWSGPWLEICERILFYKRSFQSKPSVPEKKKKIFDF